jgi:hypothetical protein
MYAFEAIGQTSLPEALQYLSFITQERIVNDNAQILYRAAKDITAEGPPPSGAEPGAADPPNERDSGTT